MFVEEIGIDAAEFGVIVELDPDEVIEWADGGIFGEDNLFGLAEDGVAFLEIDLFGGVGDEFVVEEVGPAGAIIAAPGDEHIEEGIGVVIIADPSGAGEIVIEFGLGVEIDGVFLLGELDGDAEFAFESALEFDGDIAIEIGIGAIEVIANGETEAIGEAGFGEEASGFVEIAGEAWGRSVTGACAWRDETGGGGFACAGDIFDEIFFIENEAEGFADAGIIEGFAGDIEADEIGAEEGGGMEIGAFFEFSEERGRGEAFIHHEIGEASGVEIESGVRSGGGDDIDALELNG